MDKIFCLVPWKLKHVTSNKKFGLCCMSRYKSDATTFDEHWNSDFMKYMRVGMLTDKPPIEHCRECMESGRVPYKNLETNSIDKGMSLYKKIREQTEPDGTTVAFPSMIDVRTDLCNFKCRMCSSESSTSIRQENLKFLNIVENNYGVIDDLDSMGLTMESLSHVDFINWAGGEPFMSPIHWDVMDKMLELKKNDVLIWYNTNLSFPGKTLDRAVKLLKQFKHISMGASLDGFGGDVEYIRVGLDFNAFRENLGVLVSNGINVGIDFTATSIGLLTLKDVVKLCLDYHVFFTGKPVLFGEISNHPFQVGVLKREVLEECLDKAIEVSIGTYLESDIKSFANSLLSRYNVIPFSKERLDHIEFFRGNRGYFEKRMVGKVNLP